MARRFSKSERIALYLAADGKSDLSGEPLDESFHADHKIPFSAGGATDVVNGQALTPMENLMKSDRHFVPREWQSDFLDAWNKCRQDFLLYALPGAGKTVAALLAAQAFLEGHPNGKLIIVVPSINLREQWRDAASAYPFCIELQTKEFYGHQKQGYRGVVTTYQGVASNSNVFRLACTKYPTMVIFDEIHHAGDELSWGESIKHAFECARSRLCLSGTPNRSDGVCIPFVRYDSEGRWVANMQYTHDMAIQDGVVRIVSFHHNEGDVEYHKNGETITETINRDLSEYEAAAHLRWLLHSDGTFAESLIQKAHERLTEIRKDKADAGGLVLCIDQLHAERIAKIVARVTGEEPAIIVSDSDKANSSVDEYRNSKRKWIVAVRQVSEGVDIKRLMVLCYMTNTVTDLFFRQAIGRIMRNEGTEFDGEAYCFLPDDPRLVRLAKEIEETQMQAIKDWDDDDEKKRAERAEREKAADSYFLFIGTSEGRDKGITVAGTSYSERDSALIKEISAKVGVPESKAAAALEIMIAHIPGRVTPHKPQSQQQPTAKAAPLEVQEGKLRTQLQKLSNKLAFMTKREVKEIHRLYLSIVPIQQKNMNVNQLKEKLAWLEKQLNLARMK